MSEELGKVEKPAVEEFREGRKLYFVPLVYCGQEAEEDYREKYDRYWEQVEDQISDLELKLGKVGKIYHELIVVGGDDGVNMIKDLNDRSYQIVNNRLEKEAQLEATEEGGLLTEFMDWSRCLSIGLQTPEVFAKVYQFYAEAGQKRNENITKKIDETLKADEIGILLMREGHQVQFPSDIQIFYVAPPALDEIKRWLRDRQAKLQEEKDTAQQKQ